MKKIILVSALFILVGVPVALACGGEMFPGFPQPSYSNLDKGYVAPPPRASVPEISDALKLAKCLSKKKVVMYGLDNCPYCKEQKKLFGDAFGKIKYIECGQNPKACEKAQVIGYPTWMLKGKSLDGIQSLEALGKFSQCSL